ncbi:hypothetical protein HY734_03010 [Candidatus Uhrbacteria bacterium]|nr:hypothetical protein [Candidatus Uhrbacteria bacterium]
MGPIKLFFKRFLLFVMLFAPFIAADLLCRQVTGQSMADLDELAANAHVAR